MATKTFEEEMRAIMLVLCVAEEEKYYKLNGKSDLFANMKSEYMELLAKSYSRKDLDWLLTRQIKRNLLFQRRMAQ